MDKFELLKKDLEEYLDSMSGAVEDMLDDMKPCQTGNYNERSLSYAHNAKLMAEVAEISGIINELRTIIDKY